MNISVANLGDLSPKSVDSGIFKVVGDVGDFSGIFKYSNRLGLSMIDSLILLKTHLQAHVFAYLFRFFTWDIEIKFRFFEDEMLLKTENFNEFLFTC